VGYTRDMGSTELFRYSEERSKRRRAARAKRRRVQRIGVPLAMIATAGATSTTFAASAGAAGNTRVATRTHQQRILRLHATGPDVARLQRLLGVNVDGVFGKHTLAAVKAFQHAHGLLVDGQVGVHTWAALNAENQGTASELILQYGSRGSAVANLQWRLGLTADGDFGPITRAAVEAFQRTHGLVVDGQAGPQTLGELHRVRTWHVPAADLPRGHSPHHRHIHDPGAQRSVSRGEEAVHVAERYLGVRYVYGGESPSGFDCSGLVQYVFARIGISLPRTTYAQYASGRPVSRGELEPGDLLFFDAVGHVGIYIGGGRFIHSPHTGTVVQFGSLSGWYSEHFVGARRVT
jgi:peptidoglycan DL-endopeptidase CwlO